MEMVIVEAGSELVEASTGGLAVAGWELMKYSWFGRLGGLLSWHTF